MVTLNEPGNCYVFLSSLTSKTANNFLKIRSNESNAQENIALYELYECIKKDTLTNTHIYQCQDENSV